MKCSQCEKPAVFNNGLCLECGERVHRIFQEQDAAFARRQNYLLAEMESIVGIPPGSLPREQVAPAPVHLHRRTTFNNIKVDRSVVGAINTGYVEKMDTALSHISNGGDVQASEAFAKFAEAILTDKQIEAQKRDELIEHLSFLSEQAAAKKKSAVAKTVWTSFKDSVQVIASLGAIYAQYGPIIERMFQ